MLSQSLTSKVSKVSGKVPLQIVLVVPFLMQISAAVGLVGWLSFRNGQKAVNDLAFQLQREIGARIEQNLRTYLATPHQVNQSNATAIRLGYLNVQDLARLERHFWYQLSIFDSITLTGFANPNRDLISAERLHNGSLTIRVSGKSTGYELRTHTTNSQGDRLKIINTGKNYDPRIRPWYKIPVQKGQSSWGDIYPHITGQTLYLGAGLPVYNQKGNLEGVLLTNLDLLQIGNFLRSLKIGKTGQSFIIERSGLLVATSTKEKPFRIAKEPVIRQEDKVRRLNANNSSDPLTQATAKYLVATFGNLKKIKNLQQRELTIDGRKQFLQVLPFQDDKGLDWLIVVVVPEADFMDRINANTQTTILLCLVALVLATVLGIVTARWMTKPIDGLSKASQAIANGELDQNVAVEGVNELKVLAQSFNQMAHQLRESFTALERMNEQLEHRVKERTAKLTETNILLRHEQERSERLLLNILPKPIAEQLKQDQSAIAEQFDEVTILFTDIVDFTPLACRLSPIKLVNFLDDIFSSFDQLVERYDLEKIKTIGDAYMVVGGLPVPRSDHTEAIAEIALDMQQAIARFKGDDGKPLGLRIGIHTGTVVAGVIGRKKFVYDLWGDTVNVASRMESQGLAGGIQVTEATYERLKDKYLFKKRGTLVVKGKGEMLTYWLTGRESGVAQQTE